MTTPDPSFTPPPLFGCDAVQAQLSELADSDAPLPPDLSAHLAACPACARFAELWLAGLPTELTLPPLATDTDNALRDRILAAAFVNPPNVVPFSTSTNITTTRPPLTFWLGRVAAGLAVASLAYWLLDPQRSTGTRRPAVAVAPTLSQTFLKTENKSRREQRAIQAALVDGGRQVDGNVAWAVSALEL